MMARGDNHTKIKAWLFDSRGIDLSLKSLGVIKKRNGQALDYMKSEITKHELTVAGTILDKSRKLIDRRLNRAMKIEDEMKEVQRQLDAEEIDQTTYWQAVDAILRNQLTISELNSLTKESFNQSQIEAGRPTTIAETPTQMKASLAPLLAAIANNDQEAAIKAIFPDA